MFTTVCLAAHKNSFPVRKFLSYLKLLHSKATGQKILLKPQWQGQAQLEKCGESGLSSSAALLDLGCKELLKTFRDLGANR